MPKSPSSSTSRADALVNFSVIVVCCTLVVFALYSSIASRTSTKFPTIDCTSQLQECSDE